MDHAPAETPERKAFYARIDKQNMTPLWAVLSGLITPEPKSACQPALWRFDDIRTAMLEAGALITAKEAERRVLILENPGMRGQSKITTSLYAGVQLVMPREVARRAPPFAVGAALRAGRRGRAHVCRRRAHTDAPGDFIITPYMAWHDHGNHTDKPMFWLDGLDIPIIQMLDASFIEHHDEEEQPIAKPAGDSSARYGANLLPVDHRGELGHLADLQLSLRAHARGTGAARQGRPPRSLPRHQDALHQSRDRRPCHADHGHLHPAAAQGLQDGRYRSTDATVYVAMEGRGRTRVGEQTFDWGPKDIFVAPSWKPVAHEADEESVLFSFSDRPVQEKIGVWREDRGNA